MAIGLVAANVRPINPFPGDIINDQVAGVTITAGDLVYLASTGWLVCALSAAGGRADGIALNGAAAGAKFDVLTRGRVTGFTGMTVGTAIWTAADGAAAQATATNASRAGKAISATDIFFVGSMTASALDA
jgi:hypothetical protein